MTAFSPLRYPGGKQMLANVLARIVRENCLEGGTYAEAYAGGAGAALALLYWEYVGKLLLNDADFCVFAMWRSILDNTDEFCRRIREVPLSISQWRKQKAIHSSYTKHSTLDVGFATFYLNRTNRSGIIKNGGPIGGNEQTGPWKIDARFNRVGLIARIEKIALYRERITFTGRDAIDFIKGLPSAPKLFLYLDPPYYKKGSELYLNHYTSTDHSNLAAFMKAQKNLKWVMSYDRVAMIRRLYKTFRRVPFALSYSATSRTAGKEILILGEGVHFPQKWLRRLPKQSISTTRVSLPGDALVSESVHC